MLLICLFDDNITFSIAKHTLKAGVALGKSRKISFPLDENDEKEREREFSKRKIIIIFQTLFSTLHVIT